MLFLPTGNWRSRGTSWVLIC